jgi:DNA-binding winged helix-turn-helix (wHTH) protein/TolB-like protein/Tfp pilus assembly protein PilF
MSHQAERVYQFGPFILNTAERLLLRDQRPVALEPKTFDTLVVLVEHSGRLVGKQELLKRVWPDSFVEEVNLARNISLLRKVLAQGLVDRPCIETVPKHGYRFVAEVREAPATNRLVEEEVESIADEVAPNGEARAARQGGEERRNVAWSPWFVLSGLLVVAAIGLTFLLAARTPRSPKAGLPIKSIAVLPFRPLTADASEPYLELGVADTLITRLSSLSQVVVRPTSAIRKYAEGEQDPLAAGRELRVDAVLEGSIQRRDDRIRVTVRLLRVSDGRPLWAHRCEEYCTDIFRTQDAISDQVAEALVSKLTGSEKRLLTKNYTENREAYQLYLKGRYFWNKRTAEGFEKAIEFFQQAIALDSHYALAYDGLSDVYGFLGGHDPVSQAEAVSKTRAAAKKALEIDESLSEAHASLGLIAMNGDFNWAEAEKEYKRAIELNPNYPTAHQWFGEFLAWMGRYDEAIAEVTRAHELDPLSMIISTDVGKVYAIARRYDRAIEQFKKTLEIDSQFSEAHGLLGLVYSLVGRSEEAIGELHQIANIQNSPGYLSWLGYVYGVSGRKDEARRVLARLEELSTKTYVTPFSMAVVSLGIGDKDRTLDWLERAFDVPDSGPLSLKANPLLDSLRPDRRFQNLQQRMRFPD